MDRDKNNQKSCLFSKPDKRSINQKKIDGVKKGEKHPLLSFHELPDYMKDNEYILDYYRANWPIKQALYSLFIWHNETLNVWTHLLGFLLFGGLTVVNLVNVPEMADLITMITGQSPSSVELANVSRNFSLGPSKLLGLNQESTLHVPGNTYPQTPTPNWPFYTFLSGSMFCLLSSTICHLFSCHSKTLNSHLLHLDYIGITIMIIASCFPPIYYIFHCTPHFQILYLTGITLIGIFTIFTLLSPALSAAKYRSIRTMPFVSMGLFGLIPAVHGLAINWNDPHRNVLLGYETVMAASYLIGTVFYVRRIPERWMPGWFDPAGHSHQIFHVFVLMGGLAHYGAAQVFMRTRMACDAVAIA